MTISMYLGYSADTLEPTLEPARAARCEAILEHLDTIDASILQGSLDSMAVKVGDLGVDYSSHIPLLRREGSRLLKELARLSGLPLRYDKYTAQSYEPSDHPTHPLSVQSYW